MKKTDITREVLNMHEGELMLRAIEDVKSELKDGIPAELQSEIDRLLAKGTNQEEQPASNVVDFFSKRPHKELQDFAVTELLAASGQLLSEWFAQPMNFGGAGFILDIRRVIGTENEVDIYLKPNTTDAKEMQKSLGSYIGKSLQILVLNNQSILLDAVLYIDESGTAAQGSGELLQESNEKSIKGKVSISIVVDNRSNH